MYQIVMMPRMKSSICNVIFTRMISHFVTKTLLGLERFEDTRGRAMNDERDV